MHGTELCSQNYGVLTLPLPAALVESDGSMLPGSPARSFWPELASRRGLSLSRNDCPSPNRHFEVKAPDLRLQCPTVHLPDPFGFQFPSARRLAPVRARSLPETRYLARVQSSLPFLGSPLPFRAFVPFRIKAFNPIPGREAHLPNGPDCPSLPDADAVFSSLNARSPFQTR